MEIKTFEDLIDWTRQLHAYLAECLHESAALNTNERASALLDYVSSHEAKLEQAVAEFEKQADAKAMKTRLYDYASHKPIKSHRTCDTHYADLDFDGIEREIFDFHDQVMDLYDALIGKAEIPEAKTLLEDLKALEEHEAMRLARQIGRMDDV
ncbi:ATPase [Marinobacter sp. M216]|uniref:ATPase n=1 Tax=Marinobacter albus TaxID=3030833 RepID=A0ABT7H7U1_9GAMM|nr:MULTISPECIES: ATPase [unclassified Marinobacter]MBW7471295.1 ATPase [Marinobacter sp. F4218]MDK9556428.1 ATPase [Marinobacter sp. M216]